MSHKGLGTCYSLLLESSDGLAHSQLSPYLEKLDTLEMSKPRGKHLVGKPLVAPGRTTPGQSSPREPSSTKPHRLQLGNWPLHPRSPPALRHWFPSTERGWRDVDIHHVPGDETPQSLLDAATTARISLPNPSSPSSSSSLSTITSAATEVPSVSAGSCSSRSIPAGCSPSRRDASGAKRRQTSTEGPCDSGAGWVGAAPGTGGARGALVPPQLGCRSQASTGPQPTARPARLPVGDAGPSLTHIPSFGWRFLFFPSPGAPINIPEPADIRAGADPCDAGSSRSTSHPGTPGLLPTARHQDTSKPPPLRDVLSKVTPRHPGPLPRQASTRQARPSWPPHSEGMWTPKEGSKAPYCLQPPGRGSPAQTTLRTVTQWSDLCCTGRRWGGINASSAHVTPQGTSWGPTSPP